MSTGLDRERIDLQRGRSRGPTAASEPFAIPGLISGLTVSYNALNNQVTVGPGVATVKGQLVGVDSTQALREDAATWLAARITNTRYYIYLRDDGLLQVDLDKPELNEAERSFYHPDHNNLRAIGKLFIGSNGKPVFADSYLTAYEPGTPDAPTLNRPIHPSLRWLYLVNIDRAVDDILQ